MEIYGNLWKFPMNDCGIAIEVSIESSRVPETRFYSELLSQIF